MPRTIPREEAVARVREELGNKPCLVCALIEGSMGLTLEIARDPHAVAFVSRYALRWGHVIVASVQHATTHEELGEERWIALSRMAHRAAVALERELSPLRVYTASLGTWRNLGGAPMSSPHLHLHVVPLQTEEDKPVNVFTWRAGVLDAEEAEWLELRARLATRIRTL